MNDADGGSLTKVLLLNDDVTPMDFVVHVLESIFGKTLHEATKLMLEIHHDGCGECGAYPAKQASDIVAQVTELARSHGHPLRCISRA
jgi:ATP-dependent Clp protease adaptor protein ClpS